MRETLIGGRGGAEGLLGTKTGLGKEKGNRVSQHEIATAIFIRKNSVKKVTLLLTSNFGAPSGNRDKKLNKQQ